MEFSGPKEVLRQGHMRDQAFNNYERDLKIILAKILPGTWVGPRFCRGEVPSFSRPQMGPIGILD